MYDARQAASPGQAGDKGAPVGALTPVVEGGVGPSGGASVSSPPAVARASALSSVAGVATQATQATQMSAPIAVRLAAVMGGADATPVEVTPATLTLIADPAGPLGRNTVSLANGAGAEQVVWLSHEAPDLLNIAVEQPVPSRATLLVTVDLAYAASLGAGVATGATIYVTTPTSTVPVRVNWRPLPYGRM